MPPILDCIFHSSSASELLCCSVCGSWDIYGLGDLYSVIYIFHLIAPHYSVSATTPHSLAKDDSLGRNTNDRTRQQLQWCYYYTKLHYSRGRADERAIMVATMHKTRYNSGPEATSHGTRLAVQWMAIVVVVQGHKKAAGACF